MDKLISNLQLEVEELLARVQRLIDVGDKYAKGRQDWEEAKRRLTQ